MEGMWIQLPSTIVGRRLETYRKEIESKRFVGHKDLSANESSLDSTRCS